LAARAPSSFICLFSFKTTYCLDGKFGIQSQEPMRLWF
jgi:hypothetical protein